MQEREVRRSVSVRGRRVKAAPSYWKTLVGILSGTFVLILIILNLFTFVFSVVQYYGDGMEPSLKNRQILVLRKTDQVEKGDIVAFYYNNKVLVRRVICTGGEMLTIDKGGNVYIDGKLEEEPYVGDLSMGQCNISFPYNVPIGQFFVMGDNRPVAMDSRLSEIGTISKDRIIGKVLFVK